MVKKMVKRSLRILLLILTEYMNMADGQTDRHCKGCSYT